MTEAITNRYDFTLLMDVTDGNPNGDPDAGNAPRTHPFDGIGFVTDVCTKRKVRDYVDATRADPCGEGATWHTDGTHGYKIYVRPGAALNDVNRVAYDQTGIELPKPKGRKAAPKVPASDLRVLEDFMCANFYDARAFGAVMSTKVKCGQVRGPVQVFFGESVEPVFPEDASITRCASADDEEDKENRTMGSKPFIRYGLYRINGVVNPFCASRTGFDADDLALLFEALQHMYDIDGSASRGLTTCRGLYVWRHDNAMGRMPAACVFDTLRIDRAASSQTDRPATRFEDYEVSVDRGALREGVDLTVYSA